MTSKRKKMRPLFLFHTHTYTHTYIATEKGNGDKKKCHRWPEFIQSKRKTKCVALQKNVLKMSIVSRFICLIFEGANIFAAQVIIKYEQFQRFIFWNGKTKQGNITAVYRLSNVSSIRSNRRWIFSQSVVHYSVFINQVRPTATFFFSRRHTIFISFALHISYSWCAFFYYIILIIQAHLTAVAIQFCELLIYFNYVRTLLFRYIERKREKVRC